MQKSQDTKWLCTQDARTVATAQIHDQTEKEITVKWRPQEGPVLSMHYVRIKTSVTDSASKNGQTNGRPGGIGTTSGRSSGCVRLHRLFWGGVKGCWWSMGRGFRISGNQIFRLSLRRLYSIIQRILLLLLSYAQCYNIICVIFEPKENKEQLVQGGTRERYKHWLCLKVYYTDSMSDCPWNRCRDNPFSIIVALYRVIQHSITILCTLYSQ